MHRRICFVRATTDLLKEKNRLIDIYRNTATFTENLAELRNVAIRKVPMQSYPRPHPARSVSTAGNPVRAVDLGHQKE